MASIKTHDRLVSCDGLSPDILFSRYILPYRGIKGLHASFLTFMPYLFVNDASLGPKTFSSCLFTNGKMMKELKPKYQRQDRSSIFETMNKLNHPAKKKYQIRRLNSELAWIALPSFHPANEVELHDLKKIIEDTKTIQKTNHVVIDLRGNSGGNSQWGDDLLRALYSKEFFDSLIPDYGESEIEYRVSKKNLEYIAKIKEYLKTQTGPDSDDTKHFTSIYEKMIVALNEGKDFVSDSKPIAKSPLPKTIEPQFKGHLWVLTDHKCFSSCLLFMDRLMKLLPNVTHIGRETDADTAYMEIAPTPIGNGLAQLLHPIKVNRAEYRKNNEPYTPQLKFLGNIYDDNSVENWIKSIIK